MLNRFKASNRRMEKIQPKKPLSQNAQLWVDSLRSGEFKQTTDLLCRIGKKGKPSHCCLGVACELYIRSGGKLSRSPSKDRILFGGMDDVLPVRVQKWLGLETPTGTFDYDGQQDLTELNDSGTSFKRIARLIEANADSLFK